MKELLESLAGCFQKPALFEPGEERFWDDPHISRSMLAAHLDPGHDAASRRPETIERTVAHLLSSGMLKPGDRLLDLGCGPGLYAEKWKRNGIDVTGIDISERSLDYARNRARELDLEIEYRCLNFFEMEFDKQFDAVIQVYGELCVFSDNMRDRLLGRIHKALKPGGLFLFDVSTRELRRKYGLKNGWYASEGGFWRPGRHVVLEQGFDYPEDDVWLDQYAVMDDTGLKIYRNWYHDYTLEGMKQVLGNAGFETIQAWNGLDGGQYEDGGEWIAIAARAV